MDGPRYHWWDWQFWVIGAAVLVVVLWLAAQVGA